MSFRNRPVLDRKHRPRWQDELRTQQLIVAGFALAIAVAVGIFAATAWFNYYEAHLKPVAAVGDVTYNVDDIQLRMDIIGSELQSRGLDLQDQLGGVRDSALQQGIQAISQALQDLRVTASDSLVLSQVMANTATRYGIGVTDAQVSAEVASRQTLAERVKLSLITIHALPKDAKPNAVPTDADWARAKTEIDAIAAQLKGGADFATVAKDKSADASASVGGSLGWVQADDPVYLAYFTEAHDAALATVLGPTKDASGYHLLRLEAKKAEGPDTRLKSTLQSFGVSDAAYRTYIRGELLDAGFRNYFTSTVETKYQAQREVSQIFIADPQGVPVPQQRVRHFLAQPLPGEQDQSKATDAQWAAALARADAFRVEASKPDADWYALTKTSDDPGSAAKGGDLGWYDAGSSGFVAEFKAAIAKLKTGEISQPVKTQFGYHVIEVIADRITTNVQAQDMLKTLRQHPDQFAKFAREQSDDAATQDKGGDLGWVIRYQLDTVRSDAIFELTTPGQISDVLDTDTGLYIFKLNEIAPVRWVPVDQLQNVRQSGVTRWIQEIRDGAHTWVDPQYSVAPATG
jgi:parvulin-like peptidyl-prolyl isomerase